MTQATAASHWSYAQSTCGGDMFTQVWGGVAGGFTTHPRPQGDMRGAASHTHAGGRLPRRTRVSKLLRCVDTGLEAQFKRHAWDGCGGGATTGWRCPHAPPQDLQTRGARCALPIHTKNRIVPACEKGLRPLAGVSRSAPPPHRGLPQRKNPLRENNPIRTTEKSKNRRQLKIC